MQVKNKRGNQLPNTSSPASAPEAIKVVYLHRNPDLHPRTAKIRQSLLREGFRFEVFRPRFDFKIRSRIIGSAINYFLFLVQSLFIKGDVIWVANCPDTVGLGPLLSSKKYIYDYRSPWAKEVELEFGRGIFSNIAGIIERQVRKRAEAVVVVSSQMLKDVEILRKPIFLIPNYPTKEFSPTKDRKIMRETIGSDLDKQVVLFVGKLSRVEGADMLSKIAEGLEEYPNIELWIVGDGPYKGDIEELRARHPKIIRYFGWLQYSEVPNYISAADVCIVPRHKNNFSEYYNEQGVQKIAEYLVLDKPVVACNIAKSDNYLLVNEDLFVQGIIDTINNKKTSLPSIREKRFWENESEAALIKAIKNVLSSQSSSSLQTSGLEQH